MIKKQWQAPEVKELKWEETMSGTTGRQLETTGGECDFGGEEDDIVPAGDNIEIKIPDGIYSCLSS